MLAPPPLGVVGSAQLASQQFLRKLSQKELPLRRRGLSGEDRRAEHYGDRKGCIT